MHAVSLLQTRLERNGLIGRQARVGALMRVVESLLSGGKLSLTQPGRYRAGTAYVKHHIIARRVEILLLIATLAASVQWLMGLAAKAKRRQRYFQANTERKRRVLSAVFIGNELMRSPRFKPKRIEIIGTFKCLCRLIKRVASYA